MPDHRQHRGPHPEDLRRFAPDHWPQLLVAVEHLAWLLTRGYAMPSALKLVGDRYRLCARQRLAVQRSACSDQARRGRVERRVSKENVAGQSLAVDGFNLLTTVEATLSGGVLLRGKDGCIRDMASMHGSYRKVNETASALRLIASVTTALQPSRCRWILDRPVSNSGRLRQILEELAEKQQMPWTCELANDADHVLRQTDEIVVTADSVVLDDCGRWMNLAAEAVDRSGVALKLVPLDGHGIASAAADWRRDAADPPPLGAGLPTPPK